MLKNRWTKEEVEFLDMNYTARGANFVSLQLGRTLKSVCKKAYYLRLHRDPAISLIGMRFGKWTVISKSEKRSGGNTYWLCRCDCGNEADVQRQALRHGGSKQCLECAQKIEYHGSIPCVYLTILKCRSKRRGMPMKITLEELDELYKKQNGMCALSGLPIGFFVGESNRNDKFLSSRSHTASLDRIDSSKGYLPGNIQWVHRDINMMKNLLDRELFVHLCHKVAQYSTDNCDEIAISSPSWMQKGCNKGIWDRSNG